MTNRFLISVAAAALIAGTGLANAQGTGGRDTGGASAQQSAPSSAGGGAAGGAAMQHQNGDSKAATGAKTGDTKPTGTSHDQRADDQQQKSKTSTSASESKGAGKDMKAEGRDSRDHDKKAEGREGRDSNMKAEGREGRDNNMKAEGREGRDGNMKAEGRSSTSTTTTGQAGAAARITTEQRTKITNVIREQRVAPVTNVNFSISVGTRVPRSGITLHRLPTEVVTIYPEWRGYEYILVREQIVVIDPKTYEIVAILDV